MSETNNVLPHSIHILVDDKQREIFMSFALLNRVCYLMGDGQNIPLILQDPELRESVLVEALAERDQKGKVISKKGIDEMTISHTHIQDVLEFVSEHVTDFTVAVVERANRVAAKNQQRIDALKTSNSTSTQTGAVS